MARRLLEPNPENSSIHELKNTARVGSSETALRCTAIQMLITGITREQVIQSLIVTERSLRTWINSFNKQGVDGLIVKKRPGRTTIINGKEAKELSDLIEKPEKAQGKIRISKIKDRFPAQRDKAHNNLTSPPSFHQFSARVGLGKHRTDKKI